MVIRCRVYVCIQISSIEIVDEGMCECTLFYFKNSTVIFILYVNIYLFLLVQSMYVQYFLNYNPVS